MRFACMRGDFQRYELKGTLPLLLAFVARTGNQVLNVQHIRVDEDGVVEPDGDLARPCPPA